MGRKVIVWLLFISMLSSICGGRNYPQRYFKDHQAGFLELSSKLQLINKEILGIYKKHNITGYEDSMSYVVGPVIKLCMKLNSKFEYQDIQELVNELDNIVLDKNRDFGDSVCVDLLNRIYRFVISNGNKKFNCQAKIYKGSIQVRYALFLANRETENWHNLYNTQSMKSQAKAPKQKGADAKSRAIKNKLKRAIKGLQIKGAKDQEIQRVTEIAYDLYVVLINYKKDDKEAFFKTAGAKFVELDRAIIEFVSQEKDVFKALRRSLGAAIYKVYLDHNISISMAPSQDSDNYLYARYIIVNNYVLYILYKVKDRSLEIVGHEWLGTDAVVMKLNEFQENPSPINWLDVKESIKNMNFYIARYLTAYPKKTRAAMLSNFQNMLELRYQDIKNSRSSISRRSNETCDFILKCSGASWEDSFQFYDISKNIFRDNKFRITRHREQEKIFFRKTDNLKELSNDSSIEKKFYKYCLDSFLYNLAKDLTDADSKKAEQLIKNTVITYTENLNSMTEYTSSQRREIFKNLLYINFYKYLQTKSKTQALKLALIQDVLASIPKLSSKINFNDLQNSEKQALVNSFYGPKNSVFHGFSPKKKKRNKLDITQLLDTILLDRIIIKSREKKNILKKYLSLIAEDRSSIDLNFDNKTPNSKPIIIDMLAITEGAVNDLVEYTALYRALDMKNIFIRIQGYAGVYSSVSSRALNKMKELLLTLGHKLDEQSKEDNSLEHAKEKEYIVIIIDDNVSNIVKDMLADLRAKFDCIRIGRMIKLIDAGKYEDLLYKQILDTIPKNDNIVEGSSGRYKEIPIDFEWHELKKQGIQILDKKKTKESDKAQSINSADLLGKAKEETEGDEKDKDEEESAEIESSDVYKTSEDSGSEKNEESVDSPYTTAEVSESTDKQKEKNEDSEEDVIIEQETPSLLPEEQNTKERASDIEAREKKLQKWEDILRRQKTTREIQRKQMYTMKKKLHNMKENLDHKEIEIKRKEQELRKKENFFKKKLAAEERKKEEEGLREYKEAVLQKKQEESLKQKLAREYREKEENLKRKLEAEYREKEAALKKQFESQYGPLNDRYERMLEDLERRERKLRKEREDYLTKVLNSDKNFSRQQAVLDARKLELDEHARALEIKRIEQEDKFSKREEGLKTREGRQEELSKIYAEDIVSQEKRRVDLEKKNQVFKEAKEELNKAREKHERYFKSEEERIAKMRENIEEEVGRRYHEKYTLKDTMIRDVKALRDRIKLGIDAIANNIHWVADSDSLKFFDVPQEMLSHVEKDLAKAVKDLSHYNMFETKPYEHKHIMARQSFGYEKHESYDPYTGSKQPDIHSLVISSLDQRILAVIRAAYGMNDGQYKSFLKYLIEGNTNDKRFKLYFEMTRNISTLLSCADRLDKNNTEILKIHQFVNDINTSFDNISKNYGFQWLPYFPKLSEAIQRLNEIEAQTYIIFLRQQDNLEEIFRNYNKKYRVDGVKQCIMIRGARLTKEQGRFLRRQGIKVVIEDYDKVSDDLTSTITIINRQKGGFSYEIRCGRYMNEVIINKASQLDINILNHIHDSYPDNELIKIIGKLYKKLGHQQWELEIFRHFRYLDAKSMVKRMRAFMRYCGMATDTKDADLVIQMGEIQSIRRAA